MYTLSPPPFLGICYAKWPRHYPTSFHILPSSCIFRDLIFPLQLPLEFTSAEPECGRETSIPQAALTLRKFPNFSLTHGLPVASSCISFPGTPEEGSKSSEARNK